MVQRRARTSSLKVLGTPDNFCDCAIPRDADWLDPLPIFLENGNRRDLTGKQLFIYIRPTYGYSRPIAILSTQTGTIIIDDAPAGEASIKYTRANVIAKLPAGNWSWFCVMHDNYAGTNKELFRGDLSVHEGRI